MEAYGRLELLPKARAVLEAGELFLCKDPTVKRSGGKKVIRAADRYQSDLGSGDSELLSRLKALRMDFARELGKPAFVVFSDATLIDMVERKPKTQEEMLAVSGVGPSKFERFGEAFLSEIAG